MVLYALITAAIIAADQIVKTSSSKEDIKVARDVIDDYTVYRNSHT